MESAAVASGSEDLRDGLLEQLEQAGWEHPTISQGFKKLTWHDSLIAKLSGE